MKNLSLLLVCVFLAVSTVGCAFAGPEGESDPSAAPSSQAASAVSAAEEHAQDVEEAASGSSAEENSATVLLADDFLSRSEDVAQFEMYFQILTSYVYEPCTSAELESHQMIDPAIFMCGRNSAEADEGNGFVVLDQQDVTTWAEYLFGKTIDFDQLDDGYGYDFYVDYNKEDHTVTAHTFTDKVAVRGYGISMDDLKYQADGANLYVIAPILKIEDRGIWEPYQTLRYEFVLMETEAGTPYYLLENVKMDSEEQ